VDFDAVGERQPLLRIALSRALRRVLAKHLHARGVLPLERGDLFLERHQLDAIVREDLRLLAPFLVGHRTVKLDLDRHLDLVGRARQREPRLLALLRSPALLRRLARFRRFTLRRRLRRIAPRRLRPAHDPCPSFARNIQHSRPVFAM
jgi:hypothetical protein